jgi:hypothetical protein
MLAGWKVKLGTGLKKLERSSRGPTVPRLVNQDYPGGDYPGRADLVAVEPVVITVLIALSVVALIESAIAKL